MDMAVTSTTLPIAPAVIRGEVIISNLAKFGGRGGDLAFLAPDGAGIINKLPLRDPSQLKDLYTLSLDDILDFLEELGKRLNVETNPHLAQALELSFHAAPVPDSLLRMQYGVLPALFDKALVRDMVAQTIGVDHVEGWVPHVLRDGREFRVRAFGARAVHIVAGNSPVISALTIIRNAVTRSDAIIKSPSNDPFTALAIAQTMVELDPVHPLTRHLSVAYWKGGGEALESQLYQPRNVEKIIAWGGFSGLKHITRYLQPGIELVALDPKRSISIIGADAFTDAGRTTEAALRLATDVGMMNQKGCVNSRVAFVLTGNDEAGLARANSFGDQVYAQMMKLPESLSAKPKRYSPGLKAQLQALRMSEEWFHLVGGNDDEGAVIVSQQPELVDFAAELDDRTVNVVPVDRIADILPTIDAYTQTVGIFPEGLKDELRDVLPLHGVQRMVTLGHAGQSPDFCAPQDAIEPMRRMCKWIVDEPGAQSRKMWEAGSIL